MKRRQWSIVALLLGGIALLSGLAQAGQQRAAPEEPDPTEGMSIEEIRGFQGFFFAIGGRDPLIMRFPTDEERGGGITAGPRRAPTLEEQDAMLKQWVAEITGAIKGLDYEQAVEVSTNSIAVIDNEWPPLKADHVELVRLSEEIRSLGRMAGRLKQQQDIGKEFAALGLRVDGVVWSPYDALAVVDGATLAAGEVMRETRPQGDLRVEIIEEQGVVFQYKGMRFRLPVELYAPLATQTGPAGSP